MELKRHFVEQATEPDNESSQLQP